MKEGQHLQQITDLQRRVAELESSERALQKDLDRYRDYFENIEDGCFELDIHGYFTFANAALLRHLGYTPEEFSRLRRSQRYPTRAEADRVQEIYNGIHRTGKPARSFVYEFLHKDGSVRILESSAFLIRDHEGKPVGFRVIARDVTEREKIAAERKQYRDFLESIEDVCFEMDLRGGVTFINEALPRLQGYTREEYLQLEPWQRHPSREEFKRISGMFNEILRKKDHLNILEYELKHKDGGASAFEVSVTLVRDHEGKPVGFRGVGRDITVRKKLQEESERYRKFIENIEDGCFEVDLKGNMIFVNESTCKIFGYPREEFMYMNNREYSSPETAKRLFKVFNEIYRTGIPATISDYEIIRKDGEIRYLELTASLIMDDAHNPIGFRGIWRDITDRRKVEAEREQSREFIAGVDDGCWELDLNGRTTFCNEAAFRHLGYETREEYQRLTLWQRHHTREDGVKLVKIFKKIYETGVSRRIEAYKLRRKDGGTTYADLSVTLIRDATGAPIGFRGISQDVTERVRMAEEQEQLREKLNQAQRLESLGTLAGGIAHDFNNILTGIQGYTSLMLLGKDSTHVDYKRLKIIEGQVKRAADLTKQLLGYARGGAL